MFNITQCNHISQLQKGEKVRGLKSNVAIYVCKCIYLFDDQFFGLDVVILLNSQNVQSCGCIVQNNLMIIPGFLHRKCYRMASDRSDMKFIEGPSDVKFASAWIWKNIYRLAFVFDTCDDFATLTKHGPYHQAAWNVCILYPRTIGIDKYHVA